MVLVMMIWPDAAAEARIVFGLPPEPGLQISNRISCTI